MSELPRITPESEPEPERKRASNKNAIIIALLSIIIIIQAVKWYLDSKELKEMEETKASTEQELTSTRERMGQIKVELEQKIAEIEKLGGDITELQKAKEEIERELNRSKKASGRLIKELKDKVEGYEELLKIKDEEIDRLKSVNKELLTENVTLKTQKNRLGDSINRLTQTQEELVNKVAVGARLKAENVRIVGVSDRGKERESPFKNRQLGQLKIEFNLAQNDIAPIQGKKIIIRIVDQNNQVLFDVTKGSGTFIFGGKEEFYTASQEILFDNSKQKLTYLYDKGSDYTPGSYAMEIYTDDYLMGKGQFVVK